MIIKQVRNQTSAMMASDFVCFSHCVSRTQNVYKAYCKFFTLFNRFLPIYPRGCNALWDDQCGNGKLASPTVCVCLCH